MRKLWRQKNEQGKDRGEKVHKAMKKTNALAKANALGGKKP